MRIKKKKKKWERYIEISYIDYQVNYQIFAILNPQKKQYKEYLKKQETLKKAYIDLLEIIMEEKSYNEENLELLLSIGKSILIMKEALFITIKECTFKNNNYNILTKLIERLETETDENWNLDYFAKTNNNDNFT